MGLFSKSYCVGELSRSGVWFWGILGNSPGATLEHEESAIFDRVCLFRSWSAVHAVNRVLVCYVALLIATIH